MKRIIKYIAILFLIAAVCFSGMFLLKNKDFSFGKKDIYLLVPEDCKDMFSGLIDLYHQNNPDISIGIKTYSGAIEDKKLNKSSLLFEVSSEKNVLLSDPYQTVACDFPIMIYDHGLFEELNLSVPESIYQIKKACSVLDAKGAIPIVSLKNEDGQPDYSDLAITVMANRCLPNDEESKIVAFDELKSLIYYIASYEIEDVPKNKEEALKGLAEGKIGLYCGKYSDLKDLGSYPSLDYFLIRNEEGTSYVSLDSVFAYKVIEESAELNDFLSFLTTQDDVKTYINQETGWFVPSCDHVLAIQEELYQRLMDEEDVTVQNALDRFQLSNQQASDYFFNVVKSIFNGDSCDTQEVINQINELSLKEEEN